MDCIFCATVRGELPSTKVYEDADVQAILDIHPINKGHVLVMPKAHYKDLLDCPPELLEKVILAVQKVGGAVMKGLGVNGFNLGVNNGTVAGQLILHLHFHVTPRTVDDRLQPWPGKKYAEGEMEEYGGKIRQAMNQ